MSYNRRSGAPFGSQVNYNQNTVQRPGNRPLNQQNLGYSTSRLSSYNQSSFSSQGGDYNSAQSRKQPQQSQQQQKLPSPPPPPVISANADTATASNTTRAALPPPTPPPPPQQQNQSTPSPAVPSKGELLQESNDAPVAMNEETGGENRKKPFWKNKGPGNKVTKRIKKQRQIERLKKMLTPKNAFTILKELHPGMKFIVKARLNAINQAVYMITVVIDGKTFHGQALSNVGAKQIACENALKSLFLEKMSQAVEEASEQMDTFQTESGTQDMRSESENVDDSMDGSSSVSNNRKRRFPEDDTPWGSLASFALHKLFLEWEIEGIQVPVVPENSSSTLMSRPVRRRSNSARPLNHSSSVTSQPTSGLPKPMKKIPLDANKRNPVQLLTQLKPGCQFSEQSNGIPPIFTYTMTIVINGEEFIGIAGNKKDAKKECAKAALTKMGVIYDD